jgi:hypothetical protein
MADDLNAVDPGRVEEKGPLDTDTVGGDPANGEVLVDAAAPSANDNTLKDLDSLAVPLDHFRGHPHGVARTKCRNVGLELLSLEPANHLRDHLSVPLIRPRAAAASPTTGNVLAKRRTQKTIRA